jgi:hypothetical protein
MTWSVLARQFRIISFAIAGSRRPFSSFCGSKRRRGQLRDNPALFPADSKSEARQALRRPELKPTAPSNAKALVSPPTSVVLQRLHDEAPMDDFTPGWLMGSMDKRSFGIIMLPRAVVALAPVSQSLPACCS